MANFDKALSAKATARGIGAGGESFPFSLSQLAITYNLNTWPSAQMVVHQQDSAENSAIEVLSEDFITVIANSQKSLFENALTPNMEVTLTDGAGASLVLRGFNGAPGYEYKQGAIGFQRQLLHEGVALNLLKTNIYSPDIKQGARTGSSYALEHRDPKVNIRGSIAKRFYDISALYTRKWIQNRASIPSNSFSATADRQHAINLQLFPILERILDNSRGTTNWVNSLDDIQIVGVNDQINDVLADIFLKSDGEFMQQFAALNANFPGFFAPSLVPGEYGTLYRTADLMTDNVTEINFLLREIRFNSQRSNLPATQVIVRGSPQIEFRSGVGGTYAHVATKPPVVVTWPSETPAMGIGVDSAMPAWLNGSANQFPINTYVAKEMLSADEYIRAKAVAQSYGQRVANPQINNFLKEWAHGQYVDFALAQSQIYLSVPLAVSLVPGKRYQINLASESGQFFPAFRGFLAGLTHNFTIQSRSDGVAMTDLFFTHVEAQGFELPAKTYVKD